MKSSGLLRCLIAVSFVLSMLTCGENPVDPELNPGNSNAELFLVAGKDVIVNEGDVRKIGLGISYPVHLAKITIRSTCGIFDTVIIPDTTRRFDTLYFTPAFTVPGTCTFVATSTFKNPMFREKQNELLFSVVQGDPGVAFVTVPKSFVTQTGKVDTLILASKTKGSAVAQEYAVSSVSVLDLTQLSILPSTSKDTVRILFHPAVADTYTVTVTATAQVPGAAPVKATALVGVRVFSAVAPSKTDVPQNILAGVADTLRFTVDNSTRSDKLTMKLVTDKPLDAAIFTILPSSADSILIAVASGATAAAGTVKIGVSTSNGVITDTSWYPITFVDKESAFWNVAEVAVVAKEGVALRYDLRPYFAKPQSGSVTFTSDIGTVAADTFWQYTPAYGTTTPVKATITAQKGTAALGLTLTVNVTATDTTPPTVTLVDATLNGKKVSSPQITVASSAVDNGAGVAKVSYSWNGKSVDATAQADNSWSGIITGLENGKATDVTITAIDKSMKKNSASIKFAVTYDATMLDAEPPAIVQTSGLKSGDRVKSSDGSITYTITDNTGVDSVWWMLNGSFGGTIKTVDGRYTVAYSLKKFGENSIILCAQDASAGKNKGSAELKLVYNTVPVAVVNSLPANNATGVSKSAIFKWSGGDDADGEGVTYMVNYGTTQENLSSMATVSGMTAMATLDYNKTYYWQVTAKSTSTTYPDEVQSSVGTFSTEGSLPIITADPQSQSVEAGQSVTFKVTAGGFGTLSYQWRLKGANITGATNNSYQISSVTTAMNSTTYDCVVKNEVGEVTSKAATLTVTAIPSFTVSFVTDGGLPKPDNQTVQRGGKAAAPPTNPVRSGYRFTGWYELNATHDFYFTQTTINADLTIYAGWKKVYTVTYHKNADEDGSVPAVPAVYDSGAVVTIAGNSGNVSKSGYDFKGWTTSQSGSGSVITTITATSDVDLYPKWEMKAPTITTPIADKNCPVNDAVTFSVVAAGVNLSYAWQLNGTPISNATGSSYTTSNLTVSDVAAARTYKCIVTNSAGSKDCSATLLVSMVNDIDGNVYHQVKIGTQVWLMENLKTTKYRDGTEIKVISDATSWAANLTQAAYCWANYSISSKVYGAYYNWFAASNKDIAPAGWRLPTEAEWKALFTLQNSEGLPFVSEDTYWQYSWSTTYDSTGFSAMGNGYNAGGGFSSFKSYAYWWTSVDEKCFNFGLTNYGWETNVLPPNGQMLGCGIRCIKE